MQREYNIEEIEKITKTKTASVTIPEQLFLVVILFHLPDNGEKVEVYVTPTLDGFPDLYNRNGCNGNYEVLDFYEYDFNNRPFSASFRNDGPTIWLTDIDLVRVHE